VRRAVAVVLFTVYVAAAGAGVASAAELRVLTVRVGPLVLEELRADFQRSTGHTLRLTVDLAPVLGRKIEAGEPFDLAILATPVLDRLIERGKIIRATRTDVLRAGIGVGVPPGAPKPDIGNVEAFKRALLEAKSIAYLREGASGVYLASLFQRLGIAEALAPKTRLAETDHVSEMIARGEVDLGMVVIPQMMSVPGVQVVGPLPPEIQSSITWTAGVGAGSRHPDAARAVIDLLRSAPAAPIIKAKGLERPQI
jgi:molybdate transport system substrate-binding protein